MVRLLPKFQRLRVPNGRDRTGSIRTAHAQHRVDRGYKQRFGEFLCGLIEQSVGNEAAQVAPAVTLLVEGAIVTAVIQGTPDAADVARDAALKLVGLCPERPVGASGG